MENTITIIEVENHLDKWFGSNWNNQSSTQILAMTIALLAKVNVEVVSEEITFESHPISYIQQLEQEIEDNHPSRLTSEDIEDVSDNYQTHLEYKWWKEEQLELIKDLKSKLTPEQLEWYNSFNDLKNECELNGLENQSNEQ